MVLCGFSGFNPAAPGKILVYFSLNIRWRETSRQKTSLKK